MVTSSVIFLLLTTGNLLLFLITAAPVDDICRKTTEPQRCVTILKSTDTRTPTAPLSVLEEIAIEAAMFTAGQSKIAVHNLAIFAKDPNLKTIYTNCENLHRDALDELVIAPRYLQNRRFGKLVRAAGIVGRVVGGCAAAIGKNAVLKRGIEETGVVAEAIDIIGRNLR